MDGDINTVSIGDVDGDGNNEVIAGSDDTYVYAIKSDGSLLWQYKTGDVVWCVSVGDIDGDGVDDVVAGSDDTNVYVFKT